MNATYFKNRFGNIKFRLPRDQQNFDELGDYYFFEIEDTVLIDPTDHFWTLLHMFKLLDAYTVDENNHIFMCTKPDSIPFDDTMLDEMIHNNLGSVKVFNIRAWVELTAAQAQASNWIFGGEPKLHPTEDKGLYPLHAGGQYGGLSNDELEDAVDEFGFENIILKYRIFQYKNDNGYNQEEII